MQKAHMNVCWGRGVAYESVTSPQQLQCVSVIAIVLILLHNQHRELGRILVNCRIVDSQSAGIRKKSLSFVNIGLWRSDFLLNIRSRSAPRACRRRSSGRRRDEEAVGGQSAVLTTQSFEQEVGNTFLSVAGQLHCHCTAGMDNALPLPKRPHVHGCFLLQMFANLGHISRAISHHLAPHLQHVIAVLVQELRDAHFHLWHRLLLHQHFDHLFARQSRDILKAKSSQLSVVNLRRVLLDRLHYCLSSRRYFPSIIRERSRHLVPVSLDFLFEEPALGHIIIIMGHGLGCCGAHGGDESSHVERTATPGRRSHYCGRRLRHNLLAQSRGALVTLFGRDVRVRRRRGQAELSSVIGLHFIRTDDLWQRGGSIIQSTGVRGERCGSGVRVVVLKQGRG
mmetsp:Transcript_20731/g.34896  ORF Transcript_20731/g.34896 Transcript_20731/m.34896 type:complete len:395 (+) Transcript_20731:1380-2564(+)